MPGRILILFLSGLCFLPASGQSLKAHLENNAMEIKSLEAPNPELYKIVQQADLIMIGEMHGTMEPSQLAKGIMRTIAFMEEKVYLGLEIPAAEMEAFIQHPSMATLSVCDFFTKKNIDGRNSLAWFELIADALKTPKVELFFFDYNKNDEIRDSMMYAEIVKKRIENPQYKIITLSGNMHNMLVPGQGMRTMGSYCVSDNSHFDKTRILSINHLFGGGQMLNSSGKGLELKTIDFQENIYSQSVPLDKYIVPATIAQAGRYNYTLFTRLTHFSPSLH